MLKSILEEFNNNKSFSVNLVSNKLKVSIDTVNDLVDQLIRMGYLHKDLPSTCSPSKCGGCPYAGSCNPDLLTYYKITEKGKLYLNK